jgi:hypothetical protein
MLPPSLVVPSPIVHSPGGPETHATLVYPQLAHSTVKTNMAGLITV